MKTLRTRMMNGEFTCLEGDSPIENGQEYRAHDWLRDRGWVCIRLINQEIPRDNYVWWNYPETNLDKLEIMIAQYDWYYQMSDDHRVYTVGVANDSRIRHLAELVGREVFVEMWNKYVMHNIENFRDGFEQDFLITPRNELFK